MSNFNFFWAVKRFYILSFKISIYHGRGRCCVEIKGKILKVGYDGTVWFPGVLLRPLGLAASTFTCFPISLAPKLLYICIDLKFQTGQVWWHMPLISALVGWGGQRQAEFKTSLVSRASRRTGLHRETLSGVGSDGFQTDTLDHVYIKRTKTLQNLSSFRLLLEDIAQCWSTASMPESLV